MCTIREDYWALDVLDVDNQFLFADHVLLSATSD